MREQAARESAGQSAAVSAMEESDLDSFVQTVDIKLDSHGKVIKPDQFDV